MHLDYLKDTLSPEGYILSITSLANWCNGNLMGATRKRIAEERARANAVIQPGDSTKELPTNINDPERHLDNGLPQPMSAINRGSIFASLRAECFRRAEEKNLQGFDAPRSFEDYIKGQLSSLRTRGISEDEIHNHMIKNLGVTEIDARQMAVNSLRQQIVQLEEEMEDLIAHDSDYDDSIDPDEAEGLLGRSGQQRMRTKLVDAFLYKAKQMLGPIGKFRGQFSDTLSDKRRDYLYDAIKMDDALKQFEKVFQKQIDKELDDKVEIAVLNRENNATLHRVREQMKRDFDIAVAAELHRKEIEAKLKAA